MSLAHYPERPYPSLDRAREGTGAHLVFVLEPSPQEGEWEVVDASLSLPALDALQAIGRAKPGASLVGKRIATEANLLVRQLLERGIPVVSGAPEFLTGWADPFTLSLVQGLSRGLGAFAFPLGPPGALVGAVVFLADMPADPRVYGLMSAFAQQAYLERQNRLLERETTALRESLAVLGEVHSLLTGQVDTTP